MNVYTVQPSQVFVSAREWFDRTWGNTYSSIQVFVDGRTVAVEPFTYGFGSLTHKDHAVKLLKEIGIVVAGVTDVEYPHLGQRQIGHDAADVARRKDLHHGGRGDTFRVDLAEFVCLYAAGPSEAFSAADLDFETHGAIFTRMVLAGVHPVSAASAAEAALTEAVSA